ncbi:type III polyketide synthase [Paracoccus sp. KR1-242]|uniref:type III polyketide synthase n=1 Tax=Paracoccus sp. KR1-242 TaxID=3410028 RepID=UPI003C0E6F61
MAGDIPGQAVQLLGLGSAQPEHILTQEEVLAEARAVLQPRFAQFDRLAPAFENTGIVKRHSVVPFSWFREPHGWTDRSAAYVAGASAMFCDAANAALNAAGLRTDQVDVIVTVSSTGVATPTLEALVARRMGFRADVMRVPVFGLGCAGGVSGLSVARSLAAARPGAVVLLVAVEACTLLFRLDRLTKADIIATALFGDGAAACVLRTGKIEGALAQVGSGRQHMWPDTLAIMGWSVEETGLGVIFDRAIPSFAETELRPALDALWPDRNAAGRRFDRYVCHPGGAKVITALETSLDLDEGTLQVERDVLARAGNMSAPTVLFVLQDVLASGQRGRLLTMALGPGFTLSTLPLEVP